jgi:hypothetical protein
VRTEQLLHITRDLPQENLVACAVHLLWFHASARPFESTLHEVLTLVWSWCCSAVLIGILLREQSDISVNVVDSAHTDFTSQLAKLRLWLRLLLLLLGTLIFLSLRIFEDCTTEQHQASTSHFAA